MPCPVRGVPLPVSTFWVTIPNCPFIPNWVIHWKHQLMNWCISVILCATINVQSVCLKWPSGVWWTESQLKLRCSCEFWGNVMTEQWGETLFRKHFTILGVSVSAIYATSVFSCLGGSAATDDVWTEAAMIVPLQYRHAKFSINTIHVFQQCTHC